MTIIESPTDTTEVEAVAPSPLAEGTITRVLTTGDHKTTGRIYLGFSLLFAVAVAALGVVVGLERIDLGGLDIFENANEFYQAVTAYRVGLILLVVLPLFVGLGTALVPMQVGSPAIAFPRAAASAAWTWLIGAGITIASFAIDGGLGGGDFDPTSLTVLGVGMMAVSLMLGSICVATTVVSLRAPGMSLQRVPLFSWSMLVAAIVWVGTLSVLIANLVVVYIDLRTGTNNAFGETRFDQVDWIFRQPQVFAYAIPLLGIVGEIVPVMARARQKAYPAMLALIGLFGFLGIGAFSQHGFTDELPDGLVVFAMSILVIVPVLAYLGGVGQTLGAGAKNLKRPTASLVIGLEALLLLLATTVVAAMHMDPIRFLVDFDLFATSASDAVFNGVLWASVAAAFAACWFWSSKLFGKNLPEAPGVLLGLGLVLGGLVLVVADLIAGFEEQPTATLASVNNGSFGTLGSTVETMNVIWLVGIIIVAACVALLALGIAGAVAGKGSADDDPWGGHTLEWATASPPVESNFDAPVPPVTSERPLLDTPEEAAE